MAAPLLPERQRAAGGFEVAGIRRGLKERVLAAPSFLFRIEKQPVGISGTPGLRLTNLELASRICFPCGAASLTPS